MSEHDELVRLKNQLAALSPDLANSEPVQKATTKEELKNALLSYFANLPKRPDRNKELADYVAALRKGGVDAWCIPPLKIRP